MHGRTRPTFTYQVVAADFDSNGVSLCSDRAVDPGCGLITLAGGSIRAAYDDAPIVRSLPRLSDQSGHEVDGDPVFMVDPGGTPMPNPSTGVVPQGWALIPSGIDSGERYRLLFVSSTTRNATSSNINDYNEHIIAAAGAGCMRGGDGDGIVCKWRMGSIDRSTTAGNRHAAISDLPDETRTWHRGPASGILTSTPDSSRWRESSWSEPTRMGRSSG